MLDLRKFRDNHLIPTTLLKSWRNRHNGFDPMVSVREQEGNGYRIANIIIIVLLLCAVCSMVMIANCSYFVTGLVISAMILCMAITSPDSPSPDGKRNARDFATALEDFSAGSIVRYEFIAILGAIELEILAHWTLLRLAKRIDLLTKANQISKANDYRAIYGKTHAALYAFGLVDRPNHDRIFTEMQDQKIMGEAEKLMKERLPNLWRPVEEPPQISTFAGDVIPAAEIVEIETLEVGAHK